MNLKTIESILRKLGKYMFYEALQGLLLIAYFYDFLLYALTKHMAFFWIGITIALISLFCFGKKLEYAIRIFKGK